MKKITVQTPTIATPDSQIKIQCDFGITGYSFSVAPIIDTHSTIDNYPILLEGTKITLLTGIVSGHSLVPSPDNVLTFSGSTEYSTINGKKILLEGEKSDSVVMKFQNSDGEILSASIYAEVISSGQSTITAE